MSACGRAAIRVFREPGHETKPLQLSTTHWALVWTASKGYESWNLSCTHPVVLACFGVQMSAKRTFRLPKPPRMGW